ncbi:uncharacterized protein EKO05_0010639 [Ascochyta rabiei]|nr:uncharacterized protein EKO05_0010639 [Ascochyta rabiei]UPX20407.1 hypothetical protein EKO05_0010639 [Ascochyta rabiei]
MRLPPDEYFPSRPLTAKTNHRNVHQYFPVDTSGPGSDESSSFLSQTSENASEKERIRRASTRSIRFEDEQGVLQKMYSTFVRKLTFKSGLPLKPALKGKEKAVPDEHVLPNNSSNDSFDVGGEVKVATIPRPKIQDGSPPQGPLSPGVGPAPKSTPVSKGESKTENKVSGPEVADGSQSQWTSVFEDTPAIIAKPTHKGKGKGKAVSAEDAPENVGAQTDGPASDDDCAIEDSSTDQKAHQSKASAIIRSRTPSLERLQDRSDRATSGTPWGVLRTESPERQPARYAHPGTQDRTFPIQPLPPVQPFTGRSDFTIRHFPTAATGSSVAGPSSSRVPTVGVATPMSTRYHVLVGKRLVQKSVKSQLGIKEIPSPAIRPTKSLIDTAIGFLYSDKDRRNPSEEHEDSSLD